MIKEALWVGRDGMDGIGMVIIGHRESKSTFSANKFEYFLPSFFIRLCRASIWQWPSAGLHGAELWSASLLCSLAMTAFILVVLTLPRFFVGLTVWKGAGAFHSASQSKEGNLVLALPSIKFAWNFYQKKTILNHLKHSHMVNSSKGAGAFHSAGQSKEG